MSSYGVSYPLLSAVGCAAVLLTGGAPVVAQRTQAVSSAFCTVTATSQSSVASQDAFIKNMIDIGAFACGNNAKPGEEIVNVDQQVEAVAFAIATAFAEVTAQCSARGDAQVRAQAYAFAEAEARAVGEAVSSIFASAEVCELCSAAVDATSRATQELVAQAVAEAWTDFYILSDAGQEAQTRLETITSDVVVERIAQLLSGITAEIRASANDGCSITSINEARVGDSFAICEIAISADITQFVETDAIASAGADVSAYACNGDIAEAEVDNIAEATAIALAEAIAQADIFCESSGNAETTACALSEGAVQQVARAQAEAFATAVASAATCDCAVEVSSEVRVLEEIWVEAATNAYAETCSSGDDYSLVQDFQRAFEERSLTVTARAIASAVAEVTAAGGECRVSANACAAQSPSCVRRFRPCAGGSFGDDVLPCCNAADSCVKRGTAFRCRSRSTLRAGDKIVACNLNL